MSNNETEVKQNAQELIYKVYRLCATLKNDRKPTEDAIFELLCCNDKLFSKVSA